MKSLEIANKIQNDFNECFSRYDVRSMTIIKPDFYAKEWETIKADLEVLEILKALVFYNIKSVGFENAIKSYEALFYVGIITRNQLDVLKQWLEENENDNKSL